MRERGFSLVEALVAVTILIVALGTLAQLFAFSTRANQIARAITMRTMLARQKMEDLRLQRSPPIGGSLVDDVSGFHDLPRNGYVRRWSIETVAAGSALVFRVSVTGALPGEVRLIGIKAERAR